MKVIKCPVCGAGVLEALGNEKYECKTCGNIFNAFDRSEEFRETDANIKKMGTDINQKLDNMAGIIGEEIGRNIQVNTGDNTEYKLQELLFEAQNDLASGKLTSSYAKFKKYSTIKKDSCIGHIGMYKAITNDFKGVQISSPSDFDGYDELSLALQAEDCTDEIKETIFFNCTSNIKNTLKKEFSDICISNSKNEFPGNYESNELIKRKTDKVQEEINKLDYPKKDTIYSEKDKVQSKLSDFKTKLADMEAHPRIERTTGDYISLFAFGILTLLFLVLLFNSGFFGKILYAVLAIISGIGFFVRVKTEYKDTASIKKAISVYETNLKLLEVMQEKIDTLDGMTTNNIQQYINANYRKGKSADQIYSQMIQEEKTKNYEYEKKAEEEKLRNQAEILSQIVQAQDHERRLDEVIQISTRAGIFQGTNRQFLMLQECTKKEGKNTAIKQAKSHFGISLAEAKILVDDLMTIKIFV